MTGRRKPMRQPRPPCVLGSGAAREVLPSRSSQPGGRDMRCTRSAKITLSPLAITVAIAVGCGARDEADKQEAEPPAKAAPLTAAQVQAARQAGLLPDPHAYLPLTLFDP